MSTLLNKNHPFRQSITHDSSSIESSTSSAASNSSTSKSDSKDGDEKPSKRNLGSFLSPKMKFGLGVFLSLIVCYGWNQVYDSIFPPSVSAEDASLAAKGSYGTDVEDDWGYQGQGRSVEQARNSAGIIGRLFCRGGRRSAFCD